MNAALSQLAGATGIRQARRDLPLSSQASTPKYSVLATACITPLPHPGLTRADPATRTHDYLIALAALVTLDDPRLGALVVLENSGADPEQLIDRLLDSLGENPVRRSIEVITYLAPPRPPLMHYGFAEFQMIDHLIDQSSLLGEHFIKVTGRYCFPTLPRLLDCLPDAVDFQCDSWDLPKILWRQPSRTINASLFIAGRAFFNERVRHVYQRMQQAPRCTHVENLIFDALRPLHRPGGAVCLRWPVNCEAVGMGGNGQGLGTVGRRTRSLIRALARRTVSGAWV